MDDAVDPADCKTDGFPCPGDHKQGQKHDPPAGQVGFVKGEGIDGSLGQRELVEREAAERMADILLAIPAHQLGDLVTEPLTDGGVALGIVGQEVDRGEFHRLQECGGFRPTRLDVRLRWDHHAGRWVSDGIGEPDFLGLDAQPAAQPLLEGTARFRGRASQSVQGDRVPVVVQEQDGGLLNDHPGDVSEPEVGSAEEPPARVRSRRSRARPSRSRWPR